MNRPFRMTGRGLSVYNIPMEKSSSRPRLQASARNKMMDYLAHREHSESELRLKLKDDFTPVEIDQAIAFAKEKGWVPNSEEDLRALSEKTAAALKRKGKGQLYIDQYLEGKGLAPVKVDSAEELEKARQLVENKFSDLNKMNEKEKVKAARFLISRGFDEETVRKVIYE
jgi:regulatory protein